MSITSYTGWPGSGKTYEVVKNVLLPAFCDGRRIVTNIDGVKPDKFERYVLENYPESCIGEIVVCDREDITSPSFYPVRQDDEYSFVRPGDLVIIDEAQNFYSSKLNENSKIFFREHRHFCDAKGRGCDLVLIHQSIGDIQKFLRDVVEASYRMVQNKNFGSKRSYRVFVYSGAQKMRINKLNRIYEKWVFDLYKSFSVTGGYQADVDKRQNIFNRRFFIMLVLLIFFLFFSFKALFSVFSVDKYQKSDKHAGITSLNSSSTSPPASSSLPRNVPVRPAGVNYSKRWRILGTLGVGTSRHIVVGDKDGMLRFEYPQNFKGNGSMMSGKIDGETVTKFTGEFEKKEDQKGGLNL